MKVRENGIALKYAFFPSRGKVVSPIHDRCDVPTKKKRAGLISRFALIASSQENLHVTHLTARLGASARATLMMVVVSADQDEFNGGWTDEMLLLAAALLLDDDGDDDDW